MEIFLEQIEEANKAIRTADHLAYITYPLLGDEKIVLLITDNLFNALIKTIDAILNYDRYYKRISTVPESFENKFDIFKTEVAKRYNINNETLLMIRDLKEIIETKKRSGFEFLRKNNIILCTDDYRIKTLNLKKVKEYINSTKLFINKVNTIIGKNDRRF